MRFFNTVQTADGARFWLSESAETVKHSIEFFDSENAKRCFEAIGDEFKHRATGAPGVLKHKNPKSVFNGVHYRAGGFWALCYRKHLPDGSQTTVQ